MSTKIYDIHVHLFDKTILDREVAGLAVMLSAFINVPDNDNRRIRQVLGNVDEFLTRVGSNGAMKIYEAFNEPYDTHFNGVKKVYTPLTFDLTFADDEDLGNTIGDKWIIKKRKRGLKFLEKLLTIIDLFALKKKGVDFDKLIKGLRKLIKAIHDSDDLINNQNFDQQVADMEMLVDTLGQDHILPFYSVEPRQSRKPENQVDYKQKLTDKILNGKFKGVKLYTTTGFSPTDPVLYDAGGVYDFCVQHDLPITCHNSDGGFGSFARKIKIQGHIYKEDKQQVVYNNNKPILFKHDVLSLSAGKAISERAETLNHPHLWKLALDKYPPLRINLAHFGGASSIMKLVHYTLPDHVKLIDKLRFTNWLNKFPAKDRKRVSEFYREPIAKEQAYFLKAKTFKVLHDDTPLEAEEKYLTRKYFWELLYNSGQINNWTMHHLRMIQSDQYPNLYVDLSAFTAGRLLHFEVPEALQELGNASYVSVYNTINGPVDRNFFLQAYTKTNTNLDATAWKYKIKKSLSYEDHLKLVMIFRKADYLDKEWDDALDLLKKLLQLDDAGLITYLKDNDKFSILLDLYHFKTKLYDTLEPRHKEKILYGSDFYFTQVFGPRHEQYVQDFKTVFGAEFKDIANKHSEKFLNIQS